MEGNLVRDIQEHNETEQKMITETVSGSRDTQQYVVWSCVSLDSAEVNDDNEVRNT